MRHSTTFAALLLTPISFGFGLSPLAQDTELNETVKLIAQDGEHGEYFGFSATTTSVSTKDGVSIGDTKRYQLWYRDTGSSPCNSGFNLTNGYEVTWTP